MDNQFFASPHVIDVDALLGPISMQSPSGVSLRYAGIYDAIKAARESDDDLPQGEWVQRIKTANWKSVIEIASDALIKKTKDLQIAAWLLEALVKQHGIPGFRDGLTVIRGLHEQFWDSFYPQPEDNDLESRLGPLHWIIAKLPIHVRSVLITDHTGGDNFSWLKWDEAKEVENLGRKNPEAMELAIQEGKITSEIFDKAFIHTAREFYERLLLDLDEAKEQCNALDTVLDDRYGRMAPSFSPIKAAVDDCRSLIESLALKKRPVASATPPQHEGQQHDKIVMRTPYAAMPGEPMDRNDALGRLASVAAYFRKTEPHSPVAYLIQRAIDWGQMPLEHWLRDVIHNDEVLSHVRETLGIKNAAE